MIVRANHRASAGQVSMEKSGPTREAAEAQLEQASQIQADSGRKTKRPPEGLPCRLPV